ncbi:MAG: hypothetical protein ACR2KQ_05695 [Actinomycetota bacterium]
MFVQVIQGKAKDPAGLKKQWERWNQEVKPSAKGFLGSTGGVTANGDLIVVARFENEELARANSDNEAQGAWWEETSQYVESPIFHDCTEVDTMMSGGSDDAGFVQIIQGKVKDVQAARDLDARTEGDMSKLRPDVIGGITAWHPENGRFTNTVYFTSEAEARANEKESGTSPEFQKFMEAMQANSDGESVFHDISEPWLSSK